MAPQKVSFHALHKECYYAIVRYKYAGQGLSDHWSQLRYWQSNSAGIGTNGRYGGHRFVRLDMQDLQLQRRYGFLRAYGRSKLALLLFTYELARQLQGTGITVNALEPSPTSTSFGRKGAGPVARLLLKLASFLFRSPEKGAQTSIYLASSPEVETITGKYFVKSAPRRSSALSYNEELQRQLWEESARLVKLPAKIQAL